MKMDEFKINKKSIWDSGRVIGKLGELSIY
jgi:hypothetical protein